MFVYNNIYNFEGRLRKNINDFTMRIGGDCSLVRRFCSPKVRKSEIKGSSFRRFCSPKVRKSDDDFYSFLL